MAANLIYESKPWLKSYEKGVPESMRDMKNLPCRIILRKQ